MALANAYQEHLEDGKRFRVLLGPDATGSVIMSYVRRYGPAIMKYTMAGSGGAGLLAGASNMFPQLAGLLNLGG